MAYQKWHQKNIDAGLCKDCGKPRQHGTSIYCPSCAKKHSKRSSQYKKEKREEWREQGLCYQCGQQKETNRLRCNKCHEKLMEYNRKTRKTRELYRKKNALCYQCGKPMLLSSGLCEVCLFKQYSHGATGKQKNWKHLKQLLEKQNYKCKYTGEEIILGDNASIDHIIPRSHQKYPGDNDLDNLCWTTKDTNRIKNNLTEIELIKFCKLVLENMV